MRRSYGEADVHMGNVRCGTVRVLDIHALPAVYPRLGISLGWDLREIPKSDGPYGTDGLRDYAITKCDGELRLGRGRLVLGRLWPTPSVMDLSSSPFHSEKQMTLECELNFHRLERIEQARAGKAVQLSLALWVTAIRSGAVVNARIEPLACEIPRDCWLDFLESVDFGQYDVLEFRRITDDQEQFAHMRDQLIVARRKVSRGEYNAAVAAVRTALERVIQEVRDGAPALRDILAARTDAGRGEAYTAIIKRTKDLCNLAVHKPESSIPFSREEALFIIRIAESSVALLGHFARRQVAAT